MAQNAMGSALKKMVALSAVAGMTLACGGPNGREYALPDDLCGLEIADELYDPLFPNGTELETESSFTDMRSTPVGHECQLTVDGDEVVYSRTRGAEDFQTFINYLDLPVEMHEGEPVPGDYNAVVWPGVAMAQVPCPPENMISSFMVVLRAEYPEDEEESARVLSDLIEPYMAAALDLIPEYQCGS
ncbi:hypothetical protein [Streptomyces mayteni]